MEAEDPRIEHRWRRVLHRAIAFELIPLAAVVMAFLVAILLFWLMPDSLVGFVPFAIGLAFGVSGVGWLAVGQRRLGWSLLWGRMALSVVAVRDGNVDIWIRAKRGPFANAATRGIRR